MLQKDPRLLMGNIATAPLLFCLREKPAMYGKS